MKRLLVDTGAYSDIIFLAALNKLQVDPAWVCRDTSTLVGLSGHAVQVVGKIQLPVTLGDASPRQTHLVDFDIVDGPSPFNGILGRPLLALFNGVASTCHQPDHNAFPMPPEICALTSASSSHGPKPSLE